MEATTREQTGLSNGRPSKPRLPQRLIWSLRIKLYLRLKGPDRCKATGLEFALDTAESNGTLGSFFDIGPKTNK